MSDVPTRLLRETLAGRGAQPPTSACLDAETLAAWGDGALGARERAAAELHASSCARCQALVAAMARTAPPAQPRTWWRASPLAWLVPLGAAAAALVVWMIVPAARPRPSVARPQAATRSSSPIAPSGPLPAAPLSAPPAAAAAASKSERARRSPAEDRRAYVAPRAPAPPLQLQAAEPNAMRDAASAPQPAAPLPPRAEAAAQAAAPATPNGTPPPPPAPAATVLPFAGPATGPALGARAQTFAKAVDVARPIVSPDPAVRWRIAQGGSVERTTDNGLSWQTQLTGASGLTSGAAPSPTICWLVGPAGTVVVSTDGRTWQRVSLRDAIDLTAVLAADGANATVTAADGRSFVTSDGGKTWRRVN
jgi:hypothetical protein